MIRCSPSDSTRDTGVESLFDRDQNVKNNIDRAPGALSDKLRFVSSRLASTHFPPFYAMV